MKLVRTENQLNSNRYWTLPVKNYVFHPKAVALFDQNGYDLTEVEQEYAKANGYTPKEHRHLHTCKAKWFVDEEISYVGAHINHPDLYFRHGFAMDAKEQLEEIAKDQPIYNKLLKMRPKWGVDMSIDYCDHDGNVFELLHFEWDSFFFDQVHIVKHRVEKIVKDVDWDEKAKEMLDRKEEWHKLDFFKQSDWKQKFWDLPPENFKDVIWK